jgi:hypothetical protein
MDASVPLFLDVMRDYLIIPSKKSHFTISTLAVGLLQLAVLDVILIVSGVKITICPILKKIF